MKRVILLLFIFILINTIKVQNVGINSTGSTPNASAGLDVDFADKGLLVPRVALTQTTSNAPVGASITTSLLVYNTSTLNDVTAGFYYWNSLIWVKIQANNILDWNLLGNAGITQPAVPGTYGTSLIGATENFLGTTDAKDLVIGTSDKERLRVKNTGNIGIGTAAPVNTLQVVGNASIGGAGNNVTGTNALAAGNNNTVSNTNSSVFAGQN